MTHVLWQLYMCNGMYSLVEWNIFVNCISILCSFLRKFLIPFARGFLAKKKNNNNNSKKASKIILHLLVLLQLFVFLFFNNLLRWRLFCCSWKQKKPHLNNLCEICFSSFLLWPFQMRLAIDWPVGFVCVCQFVNLSIYKISHHIVSYRGFILWLPVLVVLRKRERERERKTMQ